MVSDVMTKEKRNDVGRKFYFTGGYVGEHSAPRLLLMLCIRIDI